MPFQIEVKSISTAMSDRDAQVALAACRRRWRRMWCPFGVMSLRAHARRQHGIVFARRLAFIVADTRSRFFFRSCEQDTVLGRGTAYETSIARGTTVLAVTHSAMFDPQALSNPDDFDPPRGQGNQFHFGFGLHECLGRAIAQVMIPEIVRQSLRLKGLSLGPIDRKGGPVPESWQRRWNEPNYAGFRQLD
jgi:hypothetical protein